jgi:hypothetical protein
MVTSDRYRAILENFLRPKWNDFLMNMEQKMCGFNKMVQQPTHLVIHSEFSEMFPGHVVSWHGNIGWSPRSPDLSPCNFFLWGYHKAQVYQHHPQALEGLKKAITQEVATILLSVSTMKAAT